jgi:hypothetical protein
MFPNGEFHTNIILPFPTTELSSCFRSEETEVLTVMEGRFHISAHSVISGAFGCVVEKSTMWRRKEEEWE